MSKAYENCHFQLFFVSMLFDGCLILMQESATHAYTRADNKFYLYHGEQTHRSLKLFYIVRYLHRFDYVAL